MGRVAAGAVLGVALTLGAVFGSLCKFLSSLADDQDDDTYGDELGDAFPTPEHQRLIQEA